MNAAHPQPAREAAAPATPAAPDVPRALPSIPGGDTGDAWFTHTPGLASTRPNFTQQARSTVFLDTTTGILVHRHQTHHLDLDGRSAADILTAVFHTVPEGVERIYITAGDPWRVVAEPLPLLARRRRRLAERPHAGLAHRHRPRPRPYGRTLRPRPQPRRPLPARQRRAACGDPVGGESLTPTATTRPLSATRSSCCGRPCAATGATQYPHGLSLPDRP